MSPAKSTRAATMRRSGPRYMVIRSRSLSTPGVRSISARICSSTLGSADRPIRYSRLSKPSRTRIPAMSLMAPTKMFAAPAMSTVRPVADSSAIPAPASSGSLSVRVSGGSCPSRLSQLCGCCVPGCQHLLGLLGGGVCAGTRGNSGGDHGAAQLGEHVLEGGLGLGAVPGLVTAARGEGVPGVAVPGVPGDDQGADDQGKWHGALDGAAGAVAGLAGAEDVA